MWPGPAATQEQRELLEAAPELGQARKHTGLQCSTLQPRLTSLLFARHEARVLHSWNRCRRLGSWNWSCCPALMAAGAPAAQLSKKRIAGGEGSTT